MYTQKTNGFKSIKFTNTVINKQPLLDTLSQGTCIYISLM